MVWALDSAGFKKIKISTLQYLKQRKEVKMDVAIFVKMGKNMKKSRKTTSEDVSLPYLFIYFFLNALVCFTKILIKQ